MEKIRTVLDVLKLADSKWEHLPDYLSGYLKDLNCPATLELCEYNTLKKLVDFLAIRISEKNDRQDFKKILKIIDKFLWGLQISTEHKEKRKYVEILFRSITRPPKKNPKNRGGGRKRHIELSASELTLIKRRPTKEIPLEDKEQTISQKLLKFRV